MELERKSFPLIRVARLQKAARLFEKATAEPMPS